MTRAATFFLAVATGLVVAALVAGFTLIPSPAQQRTFNLDDKRVEAMNALTWAIASHVMKNGKLPDSLQELSLTRNDMNDVQTGRPYDYVKGEDFHYQLCATFGAPSQFGRYAAFRHPAGHFCFGMNAKVNPETGSR